MNIHRLSSLFAKKFIKFAKSCIIAGFGKTMDKDDMLFSSPSPKKEKITC